MTPNSQSTSLPSRIPACLRYLPKASILLFLGMLALSRSSQGMSIVAEGKPQAVVVLPDAPSPVVEYAAKEFVWHVERATGVRLGVLSEKDAASTILENRIYIGPCLAAKQAGIDLSNLPRNGFHEKIAEHALFLTGRDDSGMPDDPATQGQARGWKGYVVGTPPLDDGVSMGSLFAVYQWLEKQVGVRWLWPGDSGTVIPKTKGLSAGEVGDNVVIQPLIHSRPRINFTTWAGMSEASRDKYIYDTSVWLRRQRFARGVSFEYPHAYEHYWERFGGSHPEYFALRPDGKRAPFSEKTPHLVQMCVSNPGLHKQIIVDWLAQRAEHPSLSWINGAENDKANQDPSCTCEVCRSWDPPGALPIKNQAERKAAIKDTSDRPMVSLSDRYARFWLALQAEGRKRNPGATVLGYAYADYSAPPVATKLNDHVIVGIVPPYAFPLSENDRKAMRENWDGWAKTGARLYLRPNYFLVGYCMPYIFAEEFGEEFKYEAKNGMIATDFDSLLGMWGVQGPNLYVLARLNVNPDLEVSAILDEYYGAFGPAAPDVRDYFNYWKSITLKCNSEFRNASKGGWASISKAGDQIYTPETFEEGRKFLAKAKAAAVGDDELSDRIAFLNLWLEHAALSMKTLAAFHAYQGKKDDSQLKAAFSDAQIALDEFRKSHEDLIGNVGILRKVEMWSGWRRPDPKS